MIIEAIATFFKFAVLIVVCMAIFLMIAGGIWTYLEAKYEDDVEKEVQRRIDEAIRNMRFNIHIDVVEDTLGYEERDS